MIRKGLMSLVIVGSVLFAQSDSHQENYKAAVRIKLRLDDNPLLYMDEPKSAHLNTAHKESSDFIVYYERRQIQKLQSKMNGIDRAAKRYAGIHYNQAELKPKRSHIRYHYFSTVSSGKD